MERCWAFELTPFLHINYSGIVLLFALVRNLVATSVLTIFIYFGMVPQISLLFTYMSEVYPTAIRVTAITFFNTLFACFDIAVPYFSGYLSDLRPHWVYPAVWAGFFLFQCFYDTKHLENILLIPCSNLAE